MRRFLFRWFAMFVLGWAALCCARVTGSPEGGPKDKTPPVVLKEFPNNQTRFFKAKKIRIHFNEYVKVVEPQNNLVISPPMKYPPTVLPSYPSKYLEIKIEDTLKPNTTYLIDFGKSITDFNEGNILRSYKYVFSTGQYIDSLTLKGHIRSAYKADKEKFITTMLYEVDSLYTDSVIFKKTPTYVASTIDTLSEFNFTYLKPGKYRLFGLKDSNDDNKYSPEKEEIAFYDTPLTIPIDTTAQGYKFPEMKLFKEIGSEVELKSPSLVSKNRIIFGYKGGLADSLKIELMNTPPQDFKSIVLKDPLKDTLNYWMTPVEKTMDSMVFKVSYNSKPKDTFKVFIKKMYADSLVITPNIKNQISPFDSLYFDINAPLIKFNQDSLFFVDKDTVDVKYTAKIDKKKNRVQLLFKPELNMNYGIRMLPGTFKDMFNHTNDTIALDIQSPGKETYSSIFFKIYNIPRFPIILQLTDKDRKVLREQYLESAQETYDFEFLSAQAYTLRIVFDDNKNKKWDTGNVLEHRQPEEMYYFPPINLRANWDLNQEFLYDPDTPIGREIKPQDKSEDEEKNVGAPPLKE